MNVITENLRKIWMGIILRCIHLSNRFKWPNYYLINAIYLIKDPWHLCSPKEIFRFVETNRLILEHFGTVNTILEIGCGEGHQSAFLQQICCKLSGLDVSRLAIRRARRSCPESEFFTGDIFSANVDELAPIDLVVANEVLYYVEDVSLVLDRMQSIGRHIFITYYKDGRGKMAELDMHLSSTIPGIQFATLKYGDTVWRAAWWSPAKLAAKG